MGRLRASPTPEFIGVAPVESAAAAGLHCVGRAINRVGESLMRTPLLSTVLFASAAAIAAAQSSTTPSATQTASPTTAPQSVTLTGCVGGGSGVSDPFT